MGELTERLSLLSVEARSPDGGLTATVRGRNDVRVSFGGDAYLGYTGQRLAHQLEALATLYGRAIAAAPWGSWSATSTPTNSPPPAMTIGTFTHGWETCRSRACRHGDGLGRQLYIGPAPVRVARPPLFWTAPSARRAARRPRPAAPAVWGWPTCPSGTTAVVGVCGVSRERKPMAMGEPSGGSFPAKAVSSARASPGFPPGATRR